MLSGPLRFALGLLSMFLLAACRGDGCGGCAGTTPLANGYPVEQAVTNAAAVRISRPGLDYLQTQLGPIAAAASNAPGGKLTVSIPQTAIAVNDAFTLGSCPFCITFDLAGSFCPGGPDPAATPPRCAAQIDLAAATFSLDAVKPSAVVITAEVPVQLGDTPIALDVNPGPAVTLHVGYGANGTCTGANLETVAVQPRRLPVKITIPFVAETVGARTGATKLDVANAVIDLAAISGDDLQVCANCGPLTFPIPGSGAVNLCNEILDADFVKAPLVAQLRTALAAQVKTLLAAQAPGLLGTEGRIDLGALFRGISPGTTGGLEFALASLGAMSPAPGADAGPGGRTPNGLTFGMFGGVRAAPPSSCVSRKAIRPPTGIPIPEALAPTTPEAASSPHVSFAISGRFLEYALSNVYDSGLFCIGTSTEQVELLKTGLLSLLVPSIKTLTFEQADAAAAIATRPLEPPVLKLGGGTDVSTDPLVLVTLPRFAIDFYVWSFERFARVFTYTGDVSIPINLQTGKDARNPAGGILPVIGTPRVANGSLSNADTLLLDDPNIVAGAVSGIFGTLARQLVGSGIAPIDLSGATAALGLDLQLDRFQKITQASDEFISASATLAARADTALPQSRTRASLVRTTVFREHMQASTYEDEKLPELEVEVASSIAGDLETTWWIDSGTRAPWARLGGKNLVVKDAQLFVQGRHVLHVSSRVTGRVATEDASPADLPFVIDALAPFVRLVQEGTRTRLDAWDLVSGSDTLVARFRRDEGAFGPWLPARDVSFDAAAGVEVEVKDEEGNVGVVRQGLVRGRGDPSLVGAGSGCGCSTPGGHGPGGSVALAVALAALALVTFRRRSRSGLAVLALGTVAATSQGCGCGSDAEPIESGCGSDCNQTCLTGLGRGQPGAYLSVARASDGTIWAAGYNDALLAESDALLWGDLVVGPWDTQRNDVAWEVVDGIPTRADGTCPAYDPRAFRRGETDSGDDVGRWTSVQMLTNDQPIVSYYDDTHHRSKVAIKDAAGWRSFMLREQAGADAGKYGKMLVVAGKPVVAFMQLEPGAAGRTRAKVVLARSNVEIPRGAEDFVFEDIAVDEEAPCRASSCPTGEACIASTGTCTAPIAGCQPACAATQACVAREGAATCAAVAGASETYPRNLGPYISLAAGPAGLGIALYDGFRGNLVGLVDRGRAPWERIVLDGETGRREDGSAIDTGDVGIAASLAIGPDGTWHVAYADGLAETLRYVTMVEGRVSIPEVVDDGTGVDGQPFGDGKHVVGDDAVIKVEGDRVTIAYADSSSLGLRRARASGHSPKAWALTSFPQDGRWVAFPQFIPNDERTAAWWRRSSRDTGSVEGSALLFP